MNKIVEKAIQKIGFGLFFLGLVSSSSFAKIKLSSVFADNMVLQQKTDATIWGEAAPGAKVFISTTWSNKQYQINANNKGEWEIKVATPSYGGPYNITISDGETLTLKNVLIGEVWVCSGQSNMEMPLAGWGQIMNYKAEIANANYPEIRLLQVEHITSDTLLNDAKLNNGGGWQVCSPKSVAEFSATAYFFAREVYKKTKIPIGLIHTSWGGTVAEAWTSGAALKTMPDFVDAVKAIENKGKQTEVPYAQKMKIWNEKVLNADRGFRNGVAIWSNEEVDFASRKDMKVPEFWENTVLPDFDGVVWVRKSVNIPADMTGKDLTLYLGTIDDNDITYFNGKQIGQTEGYNQTRTYKIPASLVKEGNNIITIRVFDGGGGGGLYGDPSILAIKSQDSAMVSLAGLWKYKIGLDLKKFEPQPISDEGPNRPTVLFNAMINPFLKYTIKGVIWYQGESNADRPTQYRTLFPLMIKDWRTNWKLGDFPFYFVQLANYMKKEDRPVESNWAELRDAQRNALSLPQTGMATIIDIGLADNIHPKNKQEVGRRLALIALNHDYHQKNEYSGPVLKSWKVRKNQIVLKFTHAEGLKAKDSNDLKGFAIAGADGKFHWADAKISGDKVIVSSSSVTAPTAVRYDWANNPDGNLYNNSDLPASPFRTDK
ncbi:MAG TPA: sialate O-acetylesterase [Pelobium sp.]|jgi:sialate O-acetylesterase|nr:sialate O-acetylesterase [Pelobium sp.]